MQTRYILEDGSILDYKYEVVHKKYGYKTFPKQINRRIERAFPGGEVEVIYNLAQGERVDQAFKKLFGIENRKKVNVEQELQELFK